MKREKGPEETSSGPADYKGGFLEPFVSGVSLGENDQVDALLVNVQYAVLQLRGCDPEIVEKCTLTGSWTSPMWS